MLLLCCAMLCCAVLYVLYVLLHMCCCTCAALPMCCPAHAACTGYVHPYPKQQYGFDADGKRYIIKKGSGSYGDGYIPWHPPQHAPCPNPNPGSSWAGGYLLRQQCHCAAVGNT